MYLIPYYKGYHRRADLDTCTYNMLQVLHRLEHGRRQDMPFVAVADVHKTTLNALQRRDWIVVSPGSNIDVTRAKITKRGQRAYKIYNDPEWDVRHFDGLCPNCRERQRYRNPSSGRLEGYCEACHKEYEKRRNRMNRKRADGKCPHCEQPRYVTPSGYVHTYCRDCHNKRRKAQKARSQEKLRYRIQNGEVLLCQKCGERPRHVTPSVVREWCYECYTAYMHEYNQRRRYPEFYKEQTQS